MERVVYLLGAGFSAPFGLPVMRNFLYKAKDLYAAQTEQYEHFHQVFDKLDRMSATKTYFSADLLNIEEILSILEMERQVGGDESMTEAFERLIADVVKYHTPELRVDHESFINNPRAAVFGREPWHQYGWFVVGLLGKTLRFEERETRSSTGRPLGIEPQGRLQASKHAAEHSIITLNYDRILEQIADRVQEFNDPSESIRFQVRPGPMTGAAGPILCKLHGSVGSSIVPPTWNKAVHPEIQPAWQDAWTALRSANQIRVLGYSLPQADAYVKYLLKWAVVDAPNLKNIDVLCLDPAGDVRARYSEFVTFRDCRFANIGVLEYLEYLVGTIQGGASLSDQHEAFFAARAEPIR